jgi:hypothetical protein
LNGRPKQIPRLHAFKNQRTSLISDGSPLPIRTYKQSIINHFLSASVISDEVQCRFKSRMRSQIKQILLATVNFNGRPVPIQILHAFKNLRIAELICQCGWKSNTESTVEGISKSKNSEIRISI